MKFIIPIAILLCLTVKSVLLLNNNIRDTISNTGLLVDRNDEILLVSTLDGILYAITKSNGKVKWKLNDKPAFITPTESPESAKPRFFPNPQDGSLYRYTMGRGRDPLKKLPFTIPQLVASSPCRSSDGIFYFGKKVDSWIGIDSFTGKKQLVLDVDQVKKTCSHTSRNTIYLGRTLYNINLYEEHTGHSWNISFYDYSSNSAAKEVQNYDLVHYSSAGDGKLITIDVKTGSLLWSQHFSSPLVSMHMVQSDGTLLTVPFSIVSNPTLTHFTENFKHYKKSDLENQDILIKHLSPTLFIGDASTGIYILPALVDEQTATIVHRESRLLLSGPEEFQGTIKNDHDTPEDLDAVEQNIILLGYYEIPEKLKTELMMLPSDDNLSDLTKNSNVTRKSYLNSPPFDSAKWEDFWDGIAQIQTLNTSYILSKQPIFLTYILFEIIGIFIAHNLTIFLILFLFVCVITLAIFLYIILNKYAQISRSQVSSRSRSKGSNTSSPDEYNEIAEELDDGRIKVGKIIYNPEKVLGKGCDGTFVFEGMFDGRSVAVKRILPECFSIANREVNLLRSSDQHPNVIRYFCTEQCREFRYIALELCSMTLDDYIFKNEEEILSDVLILQQATEGINHLHSLGIVHRDIKPNNILISSPNYTGEVRVLISDFGLCKQLERGKKSFSKRSGITGTDGWIAPEMMEDTSKPTFAIDVFSLGCVYYYLLTKGKHPFGKSFNCQSNIISGSFSLDDLRGDDVILLQTLITKMISSDPQERPPTTAILKYPMFWNKEKILRFFQDVSDRTEKANIGDYVVRSLERGAEEVVRSNWREHMEPVIAEDLRKYRDYRGNSVRDLLRALRNKKNHYQELSESVRNVFGRVPDQYALYWTSRFPRLLIHTWQSINCCKNESIFQQYYDKSYSFNKSEEVENMVDEQESEALISEVNSLSPNNMPWRRKTEDVYSELDKKFETLFVKPQPDQTEAVNPPTLNYRWRKKKKKDNWNSDHNKN